MNTLIKTALVISSVAFSFAANATLRSEAQDITSLTTNDVVTMLGADMKMNTMELKQQLKFSAPKLITPPMPSAKYQRMAYIPLPATIRTFNKPQ